MNSHNFTIGTDPEVFLFNRLTKKYVAASDYLLTNTKKKPLNFGNGYKVLRDNIMLEWNQPPADSLDEFIRITSQALALVESKINDINIDLVFEPSIELDEDLQKAVGAKEFGCSASFNVYGFKNTPNNKDIRRYSGGHVHIGLEKELNDNDVKNLVKLLDYNLFVPSLNMDTDKTRRARYVAPGNFRKTIFGIEYRSLSNFWLKSEESLTWLYEAVKKSVDMFMEGQTISEEQIFQSITLKEQV